MSPSVTFTTTCRPVYVELVGGCLGVCAYGVYFLHVYLSRLYGCELGMCLTRVYVFIAHTHTHTETRISLGNSRIKGKLFLYVIFFQFFFLCGGVTHACLPFSFVRFLPSNLLSCCKRMYQYTCMQFVSVWAGVHVYLFLI